MTTHTSATDLKKFVTRFPDMRVGVVGDVMLDIFTRGTVHRLSPEAPVPVVLMESELQMPGGAANVAIGIRELGAHAELFGVVGTDRSGHALKDLLQVNAIDEHLTAIDHRRTTVKHRILAEERHLLRVDWEETDAITDEIVSTELQHIEERIGNWDALVIPDYAKGYMTEYFVTKLLQLARDHSLPVIVDMKPSQFSLYKDVALITPNFHEASSIAETEDVHEAGNLLVSLSNSPVLITQGENGMTLFADKTGSGHMSHLPAKARNVVDVSGAGDTVAATMTLAIAAGATLQDAMIIANEAAAIAVGKPGTSPVTQNELLESLHFN